MANTLRFKRGLVATIPTAALGEPLFTTDTFDLYIGNGTTNTRFQKYIASGATTQILRGDGSLYTFPLAISSPTNGQVLKYNGTSWVNDSDSGITGSGLAGQVAYFTGATTQGGSNNLFWDSANSRLGIGTASPTTRLYVTSPSANSTFDSGSASDARLEFRRAGTRISLFNWDTGLAGFQMDTGSYFYLSTNGSERMRLTANGRLLLGTTTEGTQLLQVNGTSLFSGAMSISSSVAGAFTPLTLSNTNAGSTARNILQFVNNAGAVGLIDTFSSTWGASGAGDDVANGFRVLAQGAGGLSLRAQSGTLRFYTGATERMRIDANGSVGIGTTSLTGYNLRISKNITGALASYGVSVDAQIQSDATSSINIFHSLPSTQAAAFNIGSLIHYFANQGTQGASSTITNQYGFLAQAGLTGATYNYGFYGNIAAATGRWNLYMNGTANNYMAGSLGIGSTAFLDRISLKVAKNITGATTAYGIENGGTIQSDVTTAAYSIRSIINTQATAFTLVNLYHFDASQGSFGAGSTVTNQYGFFANSNMSGSTNTFGFYGNIASGTGRWNFYANGTASNYFNGNVLLGSTSDSGEKLQVTGTMKVTGASTFGSTVAAVGNITSSDGTSSTIVQTVTNTPRIVLIDGRVGGRRYDIGPDPNTSNGDFRIFDNNAFASRLRIDSTGAATFSSSVTAASFIPTSSTIPTNGMYLGAANQLNFATNSTSRLNISGTGVATFSSTINVGGTATFTNASSVNIVGTSTLVGATARNTSNASGDTQAGFFVENGTSNGQLYKAGTGYTTRKTIVANDLGFYNAAAGNISILNDFASGNINFAAGGSSTAQWTIGTNGDLTAADGENIIVGTTNGTKIGTSGSQKLGFWNATPIAQPNNSIAAANFVAGIGTSVTTLDAFDGYTIGQVVKALRNAGILS